MAENPDRIRLDGFFNQMPVLSASDLHLKAGNPPLYRVEGLLHRAKSEPLTPEQIESLAHELLGPDGMADLREKGSVDLGRDIKGGRVRINVFLQKGHVGMAVRMLDADIPKLEDIHLPESLRRIVDFRQGLVLVCGITGSGKSTTLACILQMINERHRYHILTLEDPIEYLHTDAKSIINQREIGLDCRNWPDALRAAVREDPDVILVGEMRDTETFRAGLTAAETGHLVFGTLHTSSAAGTVARILDLFPTDRHTLIRQTLASNIQAIICQKLVPSYREDVHVVPAVELMFANPSIRKAIERGDDARIPDLIAVGQQEGMQGWTESFVKLIREGYVEKKIALEYAANKEALAMALRGIGVSKRAIG
ncbi:MAG: PilT/PilU family type 4a pilus ATPase [Planctomycetes bacterium]|nr:PilT/PilU family type 4a pilus ATPase [Planctomycetota bacterium]